MENIRLPSITPKPQFALGELLSIWFLRFPQEFMSKKNAIYSANGDGKSNPPNAKEN